MPRKIRRSPQATKPFVLGFTIPWVNEETVEFFSSKDYTSYSTFFITYHAEHMRYPNGQGSRYFFFDDRIISGTWLSDEANYILNAYYANRDYALVNVRSTSNPWALYLAMCEQSSISPIVVLNTLFYVYKDALYPIAELNKGPYASFGISDMTLQSDRWTRAESYVKSQMMDAHRQYSGNIRWEIGSENKVIYDAATYALIVINFTTWIKQSYPNDKVLVSMSRGSTSNAEDDQWNEDLITAIADANKLSSIDYWVVHYYPTKIAGYSSLTYFSNGSPVQADIDTRIGDTFFNATFMAAVKSYFSSYNTYTPAFSLTEFNLLDDSSAYKDTQLHALLMIDTLMKFKKEPNVVSVTKHSGFQRKNGMFYQSKAMKGLNYTNISQQVDSKSFPYVAPQAKACAVFLDSLGDELSSHSLDTDNGIELLITKTGTTGYVHILNYKGADYEDYDTSDYEDSTAKTYKFDDLSSVYWDESANLTTELLAASKTLPAYSLTTIVVPGMF